MTASRWRPSFGTSAASGGVYAVLLTALLLLSPHTARVFAQVLTASGVALPAHVVRVLDALPVAPPRDAPRRPDEAITEVADTAPVEPVPEAAAVRAPQTASARVLPAARFVASHYAARRVAARSALPGRFPARAPPA